MQSWQKVKRKHAQWGWFGLGKYADLMREIKSSMDSALRSYAKGFNSRVITLIACPDEKKVINASYVVVTPSYQQLLQTMRVVNKAIASKDSFLLLFKHKSIPVQNYAIVRVGSRVAKLAFGIDDNFAEEYEILREASQIWLKKVELCDYLKQAVGVYNRRTLVIEGLNEFKTVDGKLAITIGLGKRRIGIGN